MLQKSNFLYSKYYIFRQNVSTTMSLSPSGRQWGPGSERLRRGDAIYVEVIHTDTLGVLANGIEDPIGDVNFYANGGNNQPGCLTHSCCHDRAFELFAASMINPNLIGRGCTTKTQMNLNLCRTGYLNLGGVELSKTGNIGYDWVLRTDLPNGVSIICYADDTLVLGHGRSHQAAADLMATAVTTVVERIRQLGLEVALHKSEAIRGEMYT